MSIFNHHLGTDKEPQGNDFVEEELTFRADIPEGAVVIDPKTKSISLKAGEGNATDTP